MLCIFIQRSIRLYFALIYACMLNKLLSKLLYLMVYTNAIYHDT